MGRVGNKRGGGGMFACLLEASIHSNESWEFELTIVSPFWSCSSDEEWKCEEEG